MGYHTFLTGYITMSEEIYDDLMNNELNFNRVVGYSFENNEIKSVHVSDKEMLKDYFSVIYHEDGVMNFNCYGKHNDLEEILESVASKLGEGDMGYVESVGEDKEKLSVWLAKDKIECLKWEKPKAPDWFKE